MSLAEPSRAPPAESQGDEGRGERGHDGDGRHYGSPSPFDFGSFFDRFGFSSVGSVTPQRIAEQALHCPK
jgi:hypothetical protein